MGNKIMQETTPLVECSAFHRGMSVLEASLRNTEDSETIISGLLKGAAEFYGASRASVVEADWDLGIGVITYEWCKDGVPAQRDMLQCLPMEKFPRWRKALRANKPVVISDLQRLENVYPDEAAFFREYGVTTLLAAPFSKRINQGFIAVDDPTRYTDDPVFLFIASYAVVVELNEIKQQQSLLAATKASKYNPEDIHINFFGGMEIISSKGTLTGEDIKADQCYLLLAYLILNHKKNFSVDTLAEIICPYDELDSPYKKIAIHTMELWLANLPVTPGHVQHGTRPVVIVSNDVANNFSPIVTAVPLTSNRKAATLPTHVCLRGYGLAATSIAKCEQVMALDKSCLIRRLGEVSDWYDRLAIQHALAEQLGIELQVNLAA